MRKTGESPLGSILTASKISERIAFLRDAWCKPYENGRQRAVICRERTVARMVHSADHRSPAGSFGTLLRRYRAAAHISQRALADRAGISMQAVAALENGRRRAPYRDTLQRLAAALKLSPEERSEFYLTGARKPNDSVIARPRGGLTNLPRQLTSLVGRAGTIAEIQSLLRMSPLVTITGTGGIGKTSVAIRAAMRDLPRWKDGVWFVSLADSRDPAFVLNAIASVLGILDSSSVSTSEAVASHVKGKRLLLVLDNCEHLIAEVRVLVPTLLQASGEVAVLATSRESLQLKGERVYRVPSLAFPSEANQSAREALRYEAVMLFAERARAAESQFRLTDANARAVAAICRRLEGVPLAIELAASRMAGLAPIELAKRLDERPDVLKSTDVSVAPRQRTLSAMIGWSYELLTERERRVLQCASLFPADFALEAALVVCKHENTGENEVLEDLSSLVRKSLVVSEIVEDDVRYRLLESIGAYARDRLPPEERAAARLRYSEFFRQRAEDLERECYVVAERDWVRRAKSEMADFRAALRRSFEPGGNAIVGQRLVAALWPAWSAFAVAEGIEWNRVAVELASAQTPPEIRLRLFLAIAQLDGTLGRYESSLEAAQWALQLCESVPDEIARVRALQNAGTALAALGRGDRGVHYLKTAIEGAESLGNRRMTSFIYDALGRAHFRAGELVMARNAFARALTESDAIGAERLAANVATNLAELEYAVGDTHGALTIARQALARHQALGNERVAAVCLCNVATYLIALGQNDEGVVAATDAVKAAKAVEDPTLTVLALQHVAAAVALRGHATDDIAAAELSVAARLLAFVDFRLAGLSVPRDRTEEQEYTRTVAAIREALSADVFDACTAEGARWTLARAVAEALHFQL